MGSNINNQQKQLDQQKTKALLDFISEFISQHGYSPSYREIKSGLNYNSVATVATYQQFSSKRALN